MLLNRIAQAALLAIVLGAVGLGLAWTAHALSWTTVTVDDTGSGLTSVAVEANADPVISFWDGSSVRFAICDMSESTNDNCDQTGDWAKVAVDDAAQQATDIAVKADGDPMISYSGGTNYNLQFAICDMSASTSGNCDQTIDWKTVPVETADDVGWATSIAVTANGDPVISYYDATTNRNLGFAICDMSASTHGNCDATADWKKVTVDGVADEVGALTSIAVNANGDPVISYYDITNTNLKFAICDMSVSANTNCDQPGDWVKATVDDAAVDVGRWTSIAVDANGDPVISYTDFTNSGLKFAICDMTTGCDATGEWTKVPVDTGSVGDWGTSIAVAANGDPVISYYDSGNQALRFAMCYLSTTDCDDDADWYLDTVDGGDAGRMSSIAVGPDRRAVISYAGPLPFEVRFAFTDPPVAGGPAVGGIADLPQVASDSGWSNGTYAALAGGLAAAMLALGVGVWCARKRFSR